MRILIYGINYAPELTGIGKYTGEMAAWLARNGHEVSMVTAMPYYPEWSIHSAYRKKLWHTELKDGVRIYRCPLYVPAEASAAKRILHEFSFVLSALPVWFLNLFQKKYDVVISISPPFHLGILPFLYSGIRRSRLITHIQDLQVDAARDLGMIRNHLLLSIMFSFERFLLKKSNLISTISEGMKRKIEQKANPPFDVKLFPNWADIDKIHPLPRTDSLRAEFGIAQADKVVMYSGNLGEKQGLEILIDVAKHFALRHDLHFLIVGSGGGKKKLERLASEARLLNLKFFPLQPYDKMNALLATADLHLVLQKKSASDLVMPSKLVAILSAGGCPIVTAVPGTSLFDLISDHRVGVLSEPENAEMLIACIDTTISSDFAYYGLNARSYAESFLSKEAILKTWENQLITLTKTNPEPKM